MSSQNTKNARAPISKNAFQIPAFLAQQAFRRVLYNGEGNLAVNSATKEAIAKVTQDDLKNFHDKYYVPGSAILGVNGDFKSADMRALIEKQFGAWSGGSMPPIPAPQPPAEQAARITLVDRPASVQTFIIGGDRSVRRADPDYYALAVMNQVVGGGPQARLFLDLREEHSLTYGSYSRLTAEVYPGDWSASAPVRTPVTGDAMERFVYEYKLINDKPVPASELDDSKRAIVAGFALSLEQPAQLLGYFLTAKQFDLARGLLGQVSGPHRRNRCRSRPGCRKKIRRPRTFSVGLRRRSHEDSGCAGKIRPGKRSGRNRQARKLTEAK